MKWKGKNVCIITFVLCVLIFGIAYADTRQFPDAVNHWAEQAINNLAAKGVIAGYPDGTVRPDGIITRGEFAALLTKSLKLDTAKAEGSQPFSDISHHWSEMNIKALVEKGIIEKTDYDGSFKPDKPITRIEIIRMMVRAAGKRDEANRANGNTGFKDDSDIKNADKGYVIIAKENKIITGYPDGTIRPEGETTRGEAFQLIDNQLKLKETQSNETPPAENSDNHGSGSGGSSSSSNSYPNAQVEFELPGAAHTDTEISISPVTKYAQTLKWSIAKETEDGVQALADISQAINGSLTREGGEITFKDSGKYILTAAAVSFSGSVTKCSKAITVYPVLNPDFDLPEYTYIDKTVTITAESELNGQDVVWTATRDGREEALSSIIDGSLTSTGGSITFREKGSYIFKATVTDATGRSFVCSKEILVYPVLNSEFDLPEYTHTDKTVNITTNSELHGANVVWTATKDGREEALSSIIDGSLTTTGGSIIFKEKGSYVFNATVIDAAGRSFVCSKEILVYPVLNTEFDLPEYTYTDRTVTITTAGGDDIVWTATRDGNEEVLSRIIDGSLTSTGGSIISKEKGSYVFKATVTDATGRSFACSKEISVYPVLNPEFDLPEYTHTDKTVRIKTDSDLGGLDIVWTATRDGKEEALSKIIDGSLTSAGGSITLKEKGSYVFKATVTDAKGRSFACSKEILVYPVLNPEFDLPEYTHTDRTVTITTIGGNDIVWTAAKDGKEETLISIIDGSLTSTGGSITFREKGSYILTATVIDSTGRSFTYSRTISVYPVADIAFELPAAAHTDTVIKLVTALTNIDGLNIQWGLTRNGSTVALGDYVDGVLTDNGGNIRFKEKGVYALTARAADKTGRAFEAAATATIYPVGAAGFYLPEITYTDRIVDVKADFKELDTAVAVWKLTKDGKTVALSDYIEGTLTNNGGSIRFTYKGKYVLEAEYTDSAGRSYSYTLPVTVYPVPSLAFKLPNMAHTDTSVKIDTTTAELDNLKVEWLIDNTYGFQDWATYVDGGLDNAGGTIYFKHAGVYELVARVTDAAGRVFLFESHDRIEVQPVLKIRFELPDTAYTDRTIDVRTTGNIGVLPTEWLLIKDGEGAAIAKYIDGTLNAQGGKIRFTEAGKYTLTASITDASGRTFSYSCPVTVYPVPDINLILPQKAYAGEAVQISVNGDNLENLASAWTIAADGGSSAAYDSYASGTLSNDGGTITFAEKGSYVLTVTMKDILGRSFTCSKAVAIYPIPDIKISLPKMAYSGDTISVGVIGSEAEGINVIWSVSIDGGTAVPYNQYASGTLANNGGEIHISTDKTISVRLTADVTDKNNRSFTFSSSIVTIKPIITFSFIAPSAVHAGKSFSITMKEVSGLETNSISWTLNRDGSTASYTGSLNNDGGSIAVNAVGSYTLTAAVKDSEGRIFTHSAGIAVTNTAPNTPVWYATVTRTAKDQKLFVSFTASATDPDGDAVTYEYADQSADGYYSVGAHTVKVRAKDTFGAVSSWTEINFNVAGSAPSTPVITRTPNGNNVALNTPVTITAASTDLDGDAITYVWEGRLAETSSYPLGKNTIRVKAVDSTGMESPWAAIVFFVADPTNGGGMTLSGPESVIVEKGIEGATITEYTFTVPPVSGHSGSDYGRVRGYNVLTDTWDQLDYQTTENGITFSRKLTEGVYSQLEFYYYTSHNCMYNKSNITYSVSYYFN